MTNKELFEQLTQYSETQMMFFLEKYLKSIGYNTIKADDNEYLFAEGEIPIILVAHIDTVFTQPPQHIFYDQEQEVMWSPEGLGADDRAGVVAILQILKDGYRPSVIFTNGEEVCVRGASALTTLYTSSPFQKEMKYIIELDRQGSNDCVFYSCLNNEFKSYVKDFGFEEDFGSYTDISILGPTWNIAGVNLSIGYYDEHSLSERLDFKTLNNNVARVEVMLTYAEDAPYFKYETNVRCQKCNKTVSTYDTEFILNSHNGMVELWCWDCIATQEDAQYCDSCLNLYIADPRDEKKLCPLCKSLYKEIKYGN